MELDGWVRDGRLRSHRTSPREIADLLGLARRDLADAAVTGVSADGRFACAYHAALSLATVPLCVAGYRTRGAGHHATVFAALPEVLGTSAADLAAYLDVCRLKRNETEYRRAGAIAESAVTELISAVEDLRSRVESWLAEQSDGE